MAEQLTVLVICGSLRKRSYNAALTRALPALAPPEMKLVTAPPIDTLPFYNADVQEASGFPPAAEQLAAAIRAADGVLFVSPEYNWSMPGWLKNGIDWVSRMHDHPSRKSRWRSSPARPASWAARACNITGACR
jgi:chromate reductase